MTKIGISKAVFLTELRDYVMIFIAMMSYCIGWNIFLLPNSITTGGVPGVSSVIFWGTGIPVQWTYFGINAILLLIALRILGWKFCVKTIYAVVVLTVATTYVNANYHGHLLRDQPFMASIIGAVFCGSGVGLGLGSNGSTGGTDIIAAIVNKYRDVRKDWEKVIYGYVVLYVTAFCIDQMVNSMRRSVQFFIISEKYHEIGERINKEPHRGCTVIDAQGFYSGRDVKMLFVLAKRRQSEVIFRIINDIDPHAFVSQSAVIGVYGEGFDRFKVRTKKPKILSEEKV